MMLYEYSMDNSPPQAPFLPVAIDRAVYKLPPLHFDVEVLPPRKLGGSYVHGMRIRPFQYGADDRQEHLNGSSTNEYTVWRKWEDCIWFQEILQTEYAPRSREKRRRLAQGKGVKKGGMYINTKMASSFDSLPPGPDPNTIAKDIDEFLPSLNTKGVFRVSETLREQRHAEFQALIRALFQENVPALIKELRELRAVRDFFAYWRRDKDFERKADQENRSSVSTGAPWSLYFSASSLSLQNPFSSFESPPTTPPRTSDSTRRPNFPLRTARESIVGESRFSIFRRRNPPQSAPASYENATYSTRRSNSRSSSASDYSDICEAVVSDRQSRSSTLLAFPTSPTIQEHGFEYPDTPFDPLQRQNSFTASSTGMESSPKLDLADSPPPSAKKQRRKGVLFTDSLPPSPTRRFSETSSGNTTSSSRYSTFSTTSSSSTGQISISDLPARPSSGLSEYSYVESERAESPRLLLSAFVADGESFTQQPRHYSIASMNSVMTDFSVDRILPRAVIQSSDSHHRSVSPDSRIAQSRDSRPLSVPEEVPWPGEEDDDLIESFLESMQLSESVETRDSIQSSSRQNEPQNPSSQRFQKPFPTKHFPYGGGGGGPWTAPAGSSSEQVPTSPSSVSMSIFSDTIAIKAILAKDSIVLFPVHLGITYIELRQKLHDKFVKQEGQKLSRSFSIGYVEPRFLNSSSRLSFASSTRTGSSWSRGRGRSASISTLEASESSITLIKSEAEWLEAIRFCGGKLTLHIS